MVGMRAQVGQATGSGLKRVYQPAISRLVQSQNVQVLYGCNICWQSQELYATCKSPRWGRACLEVAHGGRDPAAHAETKAGKGAYNLSYYLLWKSSNEPQVPPLRGTC